MNNVLRILNTEKKYIMNKEQTKIEGIYDNTENNKKNNIRKIKKLTGDTISSISRRYELTKKELIKDFTDQSRTYER